MSQSLRIFAKIKSPIGKVGLFDKNINFMFNVGRPLLRKGCRVRYAYNYDVSGIVDGVIFFFEKGDNEIASETIKVIKSSKQLPTSLVWEGVNLTPAEALSAIREGYILDRGYLGIRFTLDESQLLRSYLEFLKKNYSTLISLVEEINTQVLGTVH